MLKMAGYGQGGVRKGSALRQLWWEWRRECGGWSALSKGFELVAMCVRGGVGIRWDTSEGPRPSQKSEWWSAWYERKGPWSWGYVRGSPLPENVGGGVRVVSGERTAFVVDGRRRGWMGLTPGSLLRRGRSHGECENHHITTRERSRVRRRGCGCDKIGGVDKVDGGEEAVGVKL